MGGVNAKKGSSWNVNANSYFPGVFLSVCRQYMEKEEAVNVLQFYLAADNFQDQLAAKKGQYDGQEAQNDAMILYDK